jgi:hypothetical protein
MNTTVGRRILGWRPGRTRPASVVPPWWEQWTTAACVVVAPTRSGTSNPPGLVLVLVTAHKADLCGASAEVPRS